MHRFLLLGDDQADAFLSVREFRGNCQGECRTFLTASDLITSSSPAAWFPDLAIVCQSWPREFSQNDVDRLFTWSPLTRWVVAYGPWCESDGRRHAIWPSGCRVPSWGAQTRLAAELAYLRGDSPAPPMPTSGRDELFEQHHPHDWPSLSKGTSFFLDIPDSGLRGLWQDLLMHAEAVNTHDATSATLLVTDVDPWNDREADLKRLRAVAPKALLVCLAGLANESQASAVTALGGLVVPKLAPVAHQLHQFRERDQV